MNKTLECKIIPDDDLQSVIGGGTFKTFFKGQARSAIYTITIFLGCILSSVPGWQVIRYKDRISKCVNRLAKQNLISDDAVLGVGSSLTGMGAYLGAKLARDFAEFICQTLGLE